MGGDVAPSRNPYFLLTRTFCCCRTPQKRSGLGAGKHDQAVSWLPLFFNVGTSLLAGKIETHMHRAKREDQLRYSTGFLEA